MTEEAERDQRKEQQLHAEEKSDWIDRDARLHRPLHRQRHQNQ